MLHEAKTIGKVTSAVYSPRLQHNIALAMVGVEYAQLGTKLDVAQSDGLVSATVVEKPFFDPRKKITTTSTTTS